MPACDESVNQCDPLNGFCFAGGNLDQASIARGFDCLCFPGYDAVDTGLGFVGGGAGACPCPTPVVCSRQSLLNHSTNRPQRVAQLAATPLAPPTRSPTASSAGGCVEIDECAGAPCENGGKCYDFLLAYTCDCVPGFEGVNCAVNVDDCMSNPCGGHGTCADGAKVRRARARDTASGR